MTGTPRPTPPGHQTPDTPPTGKARITATEQRRRKEAKALQLRLAGSDYDAIARQLGYTHRSGAHKAVQRAMAEAKREHADQLLEVELMRLDRLQVAHWGNALSGNTKDTDAVLKVMNHRAKLTGMYNPRADDHAREGTNLLDALAQQIASLPDTYVPVADLPIPE